MRKQLSHAVLTYLQVFLLASILFSGCTGTTDDFGEYFEGRFTDNVTAVVPADSVHIILTQLPSGIGDATVPYELRSDSSLHDTVRLAFDVLFGSYSQVPSPRRQLDVRNDTLLIWYAYLDPQTGTLGKSSSPAHPYRIETSPRLPYYKILQAIITTAPEKRVFFESIYPPSRSQNQ